MTTKNFTKEELKQALNQLVDLIYQTNDEVGKEKDLTKLAVKELISKTPTKDLVRKEPTAVTGVHGKKQPFMSKKGSLIYLVDLDVLEEYSEQMEQVTYPERLTKGVEIIRGVLRHNEGSVTGEGTISEKQLIPIYYVEEYLGYESYSFLVDEV